MNEQGQINRDYLKSYSASYTNNILDSAFKESPFLLGEDLKQLCSPEQINFNLLKTIFLQWEAEVKKMQNPYFDHSAAAVQHALNTYMQVLSRHIKLDKGSLRPLLQQAVEETLYQIFSPVYFFENYLWPSEINSFKLEELIKLKRFIRINQSLLTALIEQWEQESKSVIELSEYKESLRNLSTNETHQWESSENYILAFSKVVALRTESVWGRPEETKKESNGHPTSVNEQFAKEVKSLNEALQKSQTTLVDQLNKKVENIENLKNSLNLNQRFRFVNELYGGDSNEFNTALDKIDSCNTYHDAIEALDRHSRFRSKWDMENEAVKEFIDLVSRRFSEQGPAIDGRPFSTK